MCICSALQIVITAYPQKHKYQINPLPWYSSRSHLKNVTRPYNLPCTIYTYIYSVYLHLHGITIQLCSALMQRRVALSPYISTTVVGVSFYFSKLTGLVATGDGQVDLDLDYIFLSDGSFRGLSSA